MKRYLAMLLVFAFATTIVCAAEGKAASEATDVTLTGKLLKKEGTGDKAKVSYKVDTKDYGKVELVKTDIKLDELVGQDVEVVVKGVVSEKAGKKSVKVTAVVSAKKVEAAAAKTAEAPKAPEAPAAPAVPPTPAK